MPKLPCPTKPNTCPISQMTTYTIAQQLLHTPRVIQFQPPPSILPDRREKMTYLGHLNRGSTSMNKGEKRRLPLVSRNSEVNRRPRRSIQTLGGINLLGMRLHLKVAKVRIREDESIRKSTSCSIQATPAILYGGAAPEYDPCAPFVYLIYWCTNIKSLFTCATRSARCRRRRR